MKKYIVSIAVALLVMLCACTALAWDYETDNLPEYIVCSEHRERSNAPYVMYVYPEAGSQGTPITWYENGTVVKMITLDANNQGTYSLILGPDNTVGYAWTKRMVETKVTDPMHYPYFPQYVAASAKNDNAYMYPEPSSQGTPVNVYRNGSTFSVVNWDIDRNYCFVIAPDMQVGYVQKKALVDMNTWNNGAQYVVTAVKMNYAYLYAEAGSSGNPKAKYDNGTILVMLDWNADTNYCIVKGPDGKVGYIQKKILTTIEDYYAGKTPTPMPATPTPTPRPTPTATPWWTATPRPTATPTPMPTATPVTFWNAASYQLVLTKYNSVTNTYTVVNGTTAYMSDLGANESFRVRLHVTNTTGTSLRYSLSANLNGTNYTWNAYTLGGYKSVYHNLGASLVSGTNYITMYIDGISACSGWYNVIGNASTPTPRPTATPTPRPWYTPTPTPVPYGGSIYGHWLRVDQYGSTDDLTLDYYGNAVWNGLACTWSSTSNNLTTTTYWGTQSYSYYLSGDCLYLTSASMGLNNAQYVRINTDSALVGTWKQSGGNSTITLQPNGLMTSGSVTYSWATKDGNFYMSSLWGGESHPYLVSGNTLYLYKANSYGTIDKIYYRTNY